MSGPSSLAQRPGARCAVHPARRGADRCPVCARARCGADVASYGDRGCMACAAQPALSPPSAALPELAVRAALAAIAVAFVGGWIAAEYVDTQWFATIAPGLVGLACAWAATAAAAGARPLLPVSLASVAAVLGTGLADRLVPGGQNLFLPVGHRLPPYVAAVVGALLWRVLFGPVQPRPDRQPDRQAGRWIRRK